MIQVIDETSAPWPSPAAAWSIRAGAVVLFVLSLAPSAAGAAGVSPRFDLSSPEGGPFPSNLFTVPDEAQLTGLRIDLPKPDCDTHPSDCEDLDVVNELDGFQRSPRISVPFDGRIDPGSVCSGGASGCSDTVFLVRLGDPAGGGPSSPVRVGIDVATWDESRDPITSREMNTLHFEPAEPLDEHARYAVVITRGVRDANGDPIEPSAEFLRFRHGLNLGRTGSPKLAAYRKSLLDALEVAHRAGVHPRDVAALSVFTTLSSTATLVKLRDHVRAASVQPATFEHTLTPGAGTRSVFEVPRIQSLTWVRQTGTAPAFSTQLLTRELAALGLVQGAVGRVAFGSFFAPNYLDPDRDSPEGTPNPYFNTIRPIATRTGEPVQFGTRRIFINVFLPAGEAPPGGWPVVMFANGGADFNQSGPYFVAPSMAAQGLATIGLDLPGSGFGELSTVRVQLPGGTVTIAAGGRSVDLDRPGASGFGVIGGQEGAQAPAPRTLVLARDRARQAAADLIQLTRVIEAGVDVDGDGRVDLDPTRIHAFGFSLGGGVALLAAAVEDRIQSAAFTTPGAGAGDSLGLSPNSRPTIGRFLGARTPSLLNANGLDEIGGVAVGEPLFDETPVLPRQPAVTSVVPGAMAIQALFDRARWIGQLGSSTLAMQLLRLRPLPGTRVRPVLLQYSRGDQNVVNAAAVGGLAAARLEDRVTLYRHDVAFDASGCRLQANPHNMVMRADPTADATTREIALRLQQQVGTFLASDGRIVVDPDDLGPIVLPDGTRMGPIFEVPVADLAAHDGFNFVLPSRCPAP